MRMTVKQIRNGLLPQRIVSTSVLNLVHAGTGLWEFVSVV